MTKSGKSSSGTQDRHCPGKIGDRKHSKHHTVQGDWTKFRAVLSLNFLPLVTKQCVGDDCS